MSKNDRIHFPHTNFSCQISYEQKLMTSLVLAVGQIFFVLCANRSCCLLYRHRARLYTSRGMDCELVIEGRLFNQKRENNIKSL